MTSFILCYTFAWDPAEETVPEDPQRPLEASESNGSLSPQTEEEVTVREDDQDGPLADDIPDPSPESD